MNWRDQYRKRDKARAAAILQAEFTCLLEPTEDFPSGHFLIGDETRGYRISLWHRERGLYCMLSHDNAHVFAMTEYLLARGALRFPSSAEAKMFAGVHGWSVTRIEDQRPPYCGCVEAAAISRNNRRSGSSIIWRIGENT